MVTDKEEREKILGFMEPGIIYTIGNFSYNMKLHHEFVEAALLDLKDEGKVIELVPYYRQQKMARVYWVKVEGLKA